MDLFFITVHAQIFFKMAAVLFNDCADAHNFYLNNYCGQFQDIKSLKVS